MTMLTNRPGIAFSFPAGLVSTYRQQLGSSRRATCCANNGADSPQRPQSPKVSQVNPAITPVVPAQQSGFGNPVTLDEMTQSLHGEDDPMWELVKREAEIAASLEPQLASTLYATILAYGTLEDAVATVLATALDTATFQATQWVELFREAMASDPSIGKAIRADIAAVMERDPASTHAARVLLYSKGFHAVESWRCAHWLWEGGRESLALYMQSMISSRFAVDIHPAAQIGMGVFLDHGTGIVIGETASLGNNVSLLHNVTLGGTGKEGGDRHPKVRDGVMIGAGATILGNIEVGMGSHIAACSVVLKPVESFAVISGVPGKMVGRVTYNAGVMPSFIMDHRLTLEVMGAANPYQDVVIGHVKAAEPGDDEGLFGGI